MNKKKHTLRGIPGGFNQEQEQQKSLLERSAVRFHQPILRVIDTVRQKEFLFRVKLMIAEQNYLDTSALIRQNKARINNSETTFLDLHCDLMANSRRYPTYELSINVEELLKQFEQINDLRSYHTYIIDLFDRILTDLGRELNLSPLIKDYSLIEQMIKCEIRDLTVSLTAYRKFQLPVQFQFILNRMQLIYSLLTIYHQGLQR